TMNVGISGHRNIPERGRTAICQSMRRTLTAARHPVTGVTSLADGADQLFATLVLQQGGRLHVIVPCHDYEKSFETADALVGFQTLLARAAEIDTLPFSGPSEDAFLAAGRSVVDLSDMLLAVWDGKPAGGKGGTADIVAYARSKDLPVLVVWPRGLHR
ncbi:MAG: hypothetical protein ACRD1H_12425, partial [Vicinamibacterales bacterium]